MGAFHKKNASPHVGAKKERKNEKEGGSQMKKKPIQNLRKKTKKRTYKVANYGTEDGGEGFRDRGGEEGGF